MGPEVYDITRELATTKLDTLGFKIDNLTDAQVAYLDDYTIGILCFINVKIRPSLNQRGGISSLGA